MGYSDYIKTYYKDGKKYVDIDTEGLLKEIDNDPSVRIGIRLPDEYRINDSKFIFGEYLTSPRFELSHIHRFQYFSDKLYSIVIEKHMDVLRQRCPDTEYIPIIVDWFGIQAKFL